jgi:hypothetical protein
VGLGSLFQRIATIDDHFLRQIDIFSISTYIHPRATINLVTHLKSGTIFTQRFDFPASSVPRIDCLGFLPDAMRIKSPNPGGAVQLRTQQSYFVTVVAWILMSASISLGAGFSSSLS